MSNLDLTVIPGIIIFSTIVLLWLAHEIAFRKTKSHGTSGPIRPEAEMPECPRKAPKAVRDSKTSTAAIPRTIPRPNNFLIQSQGAATAAIMGGMNRYPFGHLLGRDLLQNDGTGFGGTANMRLTKPGREAAAMIADRSIQMPKPNLFGNDIFTGTAATVGPSKETMKANMEIAMLTMKVFKLEEQVEVQTRTNKRRLAELTRLRKMIDETPNLQQRPEVILDKNLIEAGDPIQHAFLKPPYGSKVEPKNTDHYSD